LNTRKSRHSEKEPQLDYRCTVEGLAGCIAISLVWCSSKSGCRWVWSTIRQVNKCKILFHWFSLSKLAVYLAQTDAFGSFTLVNACRWLARGKDRWDLFDISVNACPGKSTWFCFYLIYLHMKRHSRIHSRFYHFLLKPISGLCYSTRRAATQTAYTIQHSSSSAARRQAKN